MQVAMKIKHVIIDGSNIATEGRDAPSLAQLDEAVQAFIEEYSPDFVTVVVDATFPNRIDRKERQIYEDAVNANELITPPAGAIGRGDAFILQIARRADAAILSNDSFQEFHGEYPWLFEKGRLIGGKPVPHVGWVFMDRAPVRGPTSRRAVSEARKVAKAAVKSNARAKTATEASDGDAPARTRRSRTKAKTAAAPAAAAEGVDEGDDRESSGDSDGRGAPGGRGGRGGRGSSDSRGGRGRRAQPADATEASDGSADGRSAGSGRASRGVEPYNEALPFIEFVAQHPVGSEVDAVIERFSSHGAYVLVGTARAYVPLGNMGDPAPRSAKEVLRVGDDRRFVVVSIDPPRRGIDLAVPGVVAVPVTAPPDLDVVAAAARSTTEPGAAEGAEDAETAAAPEDEASEPGVATARKATTRKSPAKKAAKATGARKATKKAAAKKAAGPAADGDAPADQAAAAASSTESPADQAAEPATTAGPTDERDEASAGSSTAKKARARKAPAKRAAAKKAPAKKAAAKKTATKKTPAKAAATATRKAATKKAAAKTSPAGTPAAGDAAAGGDAGG
jgi:hypothetical protein